MGDNEEEYVKKCVIILFSLLCLGTLLWARVGDTMYVNVEEVELKSGTGFFASRVGFLPYGARVKVLEEKGKWIQVESVDNSSISGWLSASSLTRKKILASDGVNTVSASADELALAGKGFSAEVEAQYTTEANATAYAVVDEIEATPMDIDGLLDFIVQGELSDGSGEDR